MHTYDSQIRREPTSQRQNAANTVPNSNAVTNGEWAYYHKTYGESADIRPRLKSKRLSENDWPLNEKDIASFDEQG